MRGSRGAEASAIAALRAINQAQFAFSQTCGDQRYSPTLAGLGVPAPRTGQAFLSPDMTADPVDQERLSCSSSRARAALDAPPTCNGLPPVTSYQVTADPTHPAAPASGSSATNTDRVIYRRHGDLRRQHAGARRARPRDRSEVKSRFRLGNNSVCLQKAARCCWRSRCSASSPPHVELRALPAADRPELQQLLRRQRAVSCTEAYSSRYGSFMGVPVAIGGVIFFAVAALLAGFAGRPLGGARERRRLYLRALDRRPGVRAVSRLGVLLRAEGVLHPVRDHLRVGDRAVHHFRWSHDFPHDYVASSRVARSARHSFPARSRSCCCWWSSPAAPRSSPRSRTSRRPPPRRPRRSRPIRRSPPEQRAKLEAWWDVQPKVELPVPPAERHEGADREVQRLQCPACSAAHDAFKPVLAKYQGQGVEFVLKHYPLEPECNANAADDESLRVLRGGRRLRDGQGHAESQRSSTTGCSPTRRRSRRTSSARPRASRPASRISTRATRRRCRR